MTTLLLLGGLATAAASGVASQMSVSNADLVGCYVRDGSSTLDSYWFDGQSRVVASMWTPVSGTYLSEGSYEASPGQLYIEYGDGSTEQFSLEVYDDGIQLDDMWFNYRGEECP